MRQRFWAVVMMIILAGAAAAQDDAAGVLRPPNLTFEFTLASHLPADPVFKEVYPEKGSILGGGFQVTLFRADVFSVALAADIRTLSRTGASTVSQQDASLTLTPISLGPEFHLTRGVVGIWLGGGLDSVGYSETSPIKNTSGSALGFHIGGGLLFQVPGFRPLALRLYARWTKANMTTEDGTVVELGGTEMGIGLLLRVRI